MVQVELDPAVVDLARTRLVGLNAAAFDEPRLRLVLEPSTLDRPRIVDDMRLGYAH